MTFEETVALAVALVACVCDLHNRRIPNQLTLGAAVAAIIVATATKGLPGAESSAGGWIIGLLLWLPLYALGGMGAGDVKLIAAIGAWLGPVGAIQTAVYAGIAGGICALGVAIARGCLRQTWTNVQLLLLHWRLAGFTPESTLTLETSTSPRLAYAVPTLAGTILAIWLKS